MLLSTFSFCIFCICAFVHAVAVSTPRYVVCRHSCCLMLLFQGHVTCRSFTQFYPNRASYVRSVHLKSPCLFGIMLGFLSCSTRSKIFFPQIWNKRVEGTPFQFVGPKIIKGVGFSIGGWGSGRKWEY